MLIKNIQASGLLSFGPKGINLPMRKLNVLIGPNGSGKSNLLEVINLYRVAATADSIGGPIRAAGGVLDWLWKSGDNDILPKARMELVVVNDAPDATTGIRHALGFINEGRSPFVDYEVIETEGPPGKPISDKVWKIYENTKGRIHTFHNGKTPKRVTRVESGLDSSASVLAQIRDPMRYMVFDYLSRKYTSMALYRDWSFGPQSRLRVAAKLDDSQERLAALGQNLAYVVGAMSGSAQKQLIDTMRALYPGIQGVYAKPVQGGSLQLYLEEEGGIEIPASRLSDGTLRFLSLLVILLDPAPPPLIAIEEPELGLHPDVLREVARLLMEASERTQMIVTTHSRLLVDFLQDDPECIIVCEKHDGESVFERLDGKRMKVWLEDFSLGDLWSKGELGGNRW